MTPLDSARSELEAGRPWHAARLLREAYGEGAALDAAGRLLMARAEAGWRNWEGVRRLLEGARWLDDADGGEGWLLLGRSLEGTERWAEAADAYARYLALAHAASAPDAPAALARRVRTLGRAAAWNVALPELSALRTQHLALAGWLALDAARIAARAGAVAEVRSLLASVADADVRGRGWDLEPRALLAAGDTAGARAALSSALGGLELESGARRGAAWLMLGEILRATGDRGGALAAFRESLAAGAAAADAGRAARGLLELGGLDDAATALQAARALDRAGDVPRALQAFDLHARVASAATPPDVRLARARLMAQVGAREGEAVEELRALSAPEHAEVGPVALDLWARLRDRQGRTADALTLRDRLIERFPASAQAADVMFLRGDAHHDRGAFAEAVREYRRLVDASPAQDRAGLARMRWAQIHLMRGETREAVGVFESYLEAFPTGRRWEEATYWAAHARLQLGDEARARALVAELGAREPFGYYAILGAGLLGEPFTVDVPEGEEPPFPQWVRDGLRTLDLLGAAGLGEGVAATVEALRARAREADPGEALRLAAELTRHGHALAGINAGWDVQARGVPWSRRLLEVVFPLPNPERVLREAREWGADPLLVAALIRQESAWEEAIRSPAGATGLMQIMPETGRELFARHRAGDFRPELLEVGDLNLHLGTAYLVELLGRYDGDVQLALSGYNAGPHRADRWMGFPEASDALRFTERIPFAETRDYVKRVRRNRVLYQALYPFLDLRRDGL